ncbi:MAG: triose-phosphate isomerase [Chloroflexota bacterium]
MTSKDFASRVPIIGGNWKMNTTVDGAVHLAEALTRSIGDIADLDVVLCPPYPNLEAVYRVVRASTLQVGAQNLHWADAGAYTGEVSAPMLAAVGCTWVIVGHSERRHGMGESSEVVNRKARAALHHGLNIILAVGETGEERHAGRMETVLEDQLRVSFAGIEPDHADRIVVAYEPVWAIGTGETATPEQVQNAHAFVRGVLAELFGEAVAGTIRIQYGGSVTSANCRDILAQADVDGALVGGASLKPDEFAAIVRSARVHA